MIAQLDDEPEKENAHTPPRRILLGLGAVADEFRTIETALALAEAMSAEVTGHFVEESNLLNLAGLPFTKIIRPSDSAVIPIELSQMQRVIQQTAATWKRRLHARANQSSITFSFHETQGEYCSEISKVVATTDIVIINPSNISDRRGDAVAAVLAATKDAAGAVVLPEKYHGVSAADSPHPKPIVLLVTDTVPNEGTCRLARRMAAVTKTGLTVLSTASAPAAFDEVQAAIKQFLGADVPLHKLSERNLSKVAETVRAFVPSFIVWPQTREPLTEAEATMILQTTQTPLLLLRQA